MAGLGYKAFTTGEVLTAANLQGYAVDQSVMKFDSAADRTTDLASPSQGMVSFLNDSGTTWIYYGLYNASTNPGGAKAAGWYPAPGSAALFGTATRTAANLTTYTVGAAGFTLSERVDPLGWHSAVTNPTRFTGSVEGLYEFSATAQYAASVAGVVRRLHLKLNGNLTYSNQGYPAGSNYGTTVNGGIYLNGTTDYVEFDTVQDSGGNLALTCSVLMEFVRPVIV
jgi:hypothetical protein